MATVELFSTYILSNHKVRGRHERYVSVLSAKKIPFTIIDLASDEEQKKRWKRKAIRDPTFPNILVNGEWRGTFEEFEEAVEYGELDLFLRLDEGIKKKKKSKSKKPKASADTAGTAGGETSAAATGGGEDKSKEEGDKTGEEEDDVLAELGLGDLKISDADVAALIADPDFKSPSGSKSPAYSSTVGPLRLSGRSGGGAVPVLPRLPSDGPASVENQRPLQKTSAALAAEAAALVASRGKGAVKRAASGVESGAISRLGKSGGRGGVDKVDEEDEDPLSGVRREEDLFAELGLDDIDVTEDDLEKFLASVEGRDPVLPAKGDREEKSGDGLKTTEEGLDKPTGADTSDSKADTVEVAIAQPAEAIAQPSVSSSEPSKQEDPLPTEDETKAEVAPSAEQKADVETSTAVETSVVSSPKEDVSTLTTSPKATPDAAVLEEPAEGKDPAFPASAPGEAGASASPSELPSTLVADDAERAPADAAATTEVVPSKDEIATKEDVSANAGEDAGHEAEIQPSSAEDGRQAEDTKVSEGGAAPTTSGNGGSSEGMVDTAEKITALEAQTRDEQERCAEEKVAPDGALSLGAQVDEVSASALSTGPADVQPVEIHSSEAVVANAKSASPVATETTADESDVHVQPVPSPSEQGEAGQEVPFPQDKLAAPVSPASPTSSRQLSAGPSPTDAELPRQARRSPSVLLAPSIRSKRSTSSLSPASRSRTVSSSSSSAPFSMPFIQPDANELMEPLPAPIVPPLSIIASGGDHAGYNLSDDSNYAYLGSPMSAATYTSFSALASPAESHGGSPTSAGISPGGGTASNDNAWSRRSSVVVPPATPTRRRASRSNSRTTSPARSPTSSRTNLRGDAAAAPPVPPLPRQGSLSSLKSARSISGSRTKDKEAPPPLPKSPPPPVPTSPGLSSPSTRAQPQSPASPSTPGLTGYSAEQAITSKPNSPSQPRPRSPQDTSPRPNVTHTHGIADPPSPTDSLPPPLPPKSPVSSFHQTPTTANSSHSPPRGARGHKKTLSEILREADAAMAEASDGEEKGED